ncbi:MAG: ATP-binding protein [Deltaproteobacteria bacterium]|nr:ATP-binding protein [Deltaproteobacteria bacterium]
MYQRSYFNKILQRLKEPRHFIQVLSGPRQSGKTTLICQITQATDVPIHYALADDPSIRDRIWIEQQWEIGRLKTREMGKAILVLDELQKIEGWSETVKYLWDSDTLSELGLIVVILGSSPLLVQRGLTESLAGRFEVLHIPHWSYAEMRDAFGWNLEKYIFFGGYPGAAPLVEDEKRWRSYVIDSLIETSVSKDILLMKRIDKPALLRRLFHLGCEYSGRILSYQKMLGQLQDAGNTTTLAHYLELLGNAWMLCGLNKFAGQSVRRRGSSPKFQVFNNALMTATVGVTFKEALADREFWGHLVESAVGAAFINAFIGDFGNVFYWREKNQEVDFVISRGKTLAAVEVKSGRRRENYSGMESFARQFKPQKQLLIGGDGISLEDFFSKPAEQFA